MLWRRKPTASLDVGGKGGKGSKGGKGGSTSTSASTSKILPLAQSSRGQKRPAPDDDDEQREEANGGFKKVMRTVTWYSYNGGLQGELDIEAVKTPLRALPTYEALKLLKCMGEKASEIRNPTAWLRSAAGKVAPDLDPRVKRTLYWYNKHGGLPNEVRYEDVKPDLLAISANEALRILKGFDGKGEEIANPTAWLCKAAQKVAQRRGYEVQGGDAGAVVEAATALSGIDPRDYLDAKVSKTLAWYNKFGGLQQPIRVEEIAPMLASMTTSEALLLLKGLDGKGPGIRDPTSWLMKGAHAQLARDEKLPSAGAVAAVPTKRVMLKPTIIFGVEQDEED